jgi:predicted DNA binding CopG/RHH family protein
MPMPKPKVTRPKFRTEKEEAEWWDANPAVATRLLKQALKQGTVRRKVGSPTRVVTMRLPSRDLDTAQDLAGRKGLRYQTYIKMLLHQALQKELATAS